MSLNDYVRMPSHFEFSEEIRHAPNVDPRQPLMSVCPSCFSVVAAPEAHADWHKNLISYLTGTRIEAEAQSTEGNSNGQ